MKIALNEASTLNIENTGAYVTFNDWQAPDNIRYGYSTRMLGESTGVFASMNFGTKLGDDPKIVKRNYERMCNALRMPSKRLVISKQTHSCNVKKVTEEDAGNGIVFENRFNAVDAMMTNVKNLPLVISTADCVPVFFCDSKGEVIAAAHAGWRGTVGGIVKNTVESMTKEYGLKPENIYAAIGPSICRHCFEIGPEVATEFEKEFDLPMDESDSVLYHGEGDRFYADLWKANAINLERAGVRKENIAFSRLCTMCRTDLFFSHRVMGERRGSNCGFIMLNC